MVNFLRICVVSACVAGGVPEQPAAADVFHGYGRAYTAIPMPRIAPGSFGLVGDNLADGRMIALTGNEIHVETGVATGQFVLGARLDPALVGGVADPAFISVSPDGTRIAIGAGLGKPLVVMASDALDAGLVPTITGAAAAVFDVPHNTAAWADSSHLAINTGQFGEPSRITLLDVDSSRASPVNPTIINGIGGASSAVAFDAVGRLFTANGFDIDSASGSSTGHIRAFESAAWMGAAAAGSPILFETAGVFVADVLSGASLEFDGDGNLFVGGFGDTDFGYFAVLSGSAMTMALTGGAPVDLFNPDAARFLAPESDPLAYYTGIFNHVTGALYIASTQFSTGQTTWYATVPAPHGAGVVMVLWMSAGGRRRRRHA